MARHDCPWEPAAAAVGVGQVSSSKPHGYQTTQAQGDHAWMGSALSVAAAALYEQTSNGAASAAAGPRRTVRPFWGIMACGVPSTSRVALEYSKQEGHCHNRTH
jgi:hypothetical protein